jgi:hypothetical protein
VSVLDAEHAGDLGDGHQAELSFPDGVGDLGELADERDGDRGLQERPWPRQEPRSRSMPRARIV